MLYRKFTILLTSFILDSTSFIPSHSCPTKPIEQAQIPVERSQYPFPEQFPSPGHWWSVVVAVIVVFVAVLVDADVVDKLQDSPVQPSKQRQKSGWTHCPWLSTQPWLQIAEKVCDNYFD